METADRDLIQRIDGRLQMSAPGTWRTSSAPISSGDFPKYSANSFTA
jgi:hypothetical protein